MAKPPAAPDDPLTAAARLAAGAGAAGVRLASEVVGGVLRRLPGRPPRD